MGLTMEIRSTGKGLLVIALIAMVSACSNAEQENQSVNQSLEPAASTLNDEKPDTQPSQIEIYAYTMLAPGEGDNPLIYARIVMGQLSAQCPTLIGSDNKLVKTVARKRHLGSQSAVVTDQNFPITVCEAIVAEGVSYQDSDGHISLKEVTLSPTHVQVYGDSGCKEKNCGVQPAQAFQSVASVGAAQTKQLILHMGDFNYRGTSGHFAKTSSGNKIWAYDAGDGAPNPTPACGFNDTYYSQNALNSPKPDRWRNWKLDFFEAGKSLLSSAPWVFARGNHELCSRAGVGWFYLFGPGSNLAGSVTPQMQCPDQGDFNNPPSSAVGHIQVIPPYMLKLGEFQTWVMDTANACDDFAGNQLTTNYTAQYNLLATKADGGLPTWVMSHRPVWGYQGSTINVMLQTALKKSNAKAFTPDVQLLLAGHMHIYESLTFFDDNGEPSARPPQLVIGNSGVSLNSAPNFKPCLNGDCTVVDGLNVKGNALSEFGFLSMELQRGGEWQGKLLDEKQCSIADCDSTNPANGKSICVLNQPSSGRCLM